MTICVKNLSIKVSRHDSDNETLILLSLNHHSCWICVHDKVKSGVHTDHGTNYITHCITIEAWPKLASTLCIA